MSRSYTSLVPLEQERTILAAVLQELNALGAHVAVVEKKRYVNPSEQDQTYLTIHSVNGQQVKFNIYNKRTWSRDDGTVYITVDDGTYMRTGFKPRHYPPTKNGKQHNYRKVAEALIEAAASQDRADADRVEAAKRSAEANDNREKYRRYATALYTSTGRVRVSSGEYGVKLEIMSTDLEEARFVMAAMQECVANYRNASKGEV